MYKVKLKLMLLKIKNLIFLGKIFYRLYKNFLFIAKKRYIWFIFLTFPPFGSFLNFISKNFLLKILNKNFQIRLFESILYKSTIRFLSVEEKNNIALILPTYNKNQNYFLPEINSYNFNLEESLNELRSNGFVNLGTIFSNDQCLKFINNLDNQYYYDSQVPMQSSGVKKKFLLNSRGNINNNHYSCFSPETTVKFKPLKDFVNSNEIKYLINNYLNFEGKIYNAITWYNSKAPGKHYVHRLHRDYDDFKFIGLFIYWNDIDQNNGPFYFAPKSHRLEVNNPKDIPLIGKAGTVFIVDSFGLHRGSAILDKERFISTFRFGKLLNSASINDCFLTTPSY